MTADVYAGDEDQNGARRFVAHPYGTTIKLRADAEPDVLLRIAAQLNLLNCAPMHFVLERGTETDVLVHVHIVGCATAAIDLVCRKLGQLTCVYEVTHETTQ